MANEAAWDLGYQQGAQMAAVRRARNDQDWLDQHNEWLTNRNNINAKLQTLTYDPETGAPDPAYQKQYNGLQKALQQSDLQKQQLWHPSIYPMAIAKFGHLFHLGGNSTVPNPVAASTTTQPQDMQVPADNTPVTLSPEQAYSRTATMPSQGAPVTEAGVSASQIDPSALAVGVSGSSPPLPGEAMMPVAVNPSTAVASTRLAFPASKPVTVASVKPDQYKKEMAARMKAQQEAYQIAMGAPLTPEQSAVRAANAEEAGKAATYNARIAQYQQSHPDATPDEIAQNKEQTYYNIFGVTGTANWQPVTGYVDGSTQPVTLYHDARSNRFMNAGMQVVNPEEMHWHANPKSAAEENLTQYNAALADGYKGGYQQWIKEQGAKKGYAFEAQTGQVTEPGTGKRWSVEDIKSGNMPPAVVKMFMDNKALMDYKHRQAMELQVGRYEALNRTRYAMFMDPDHPGAVIPATYADAVSRGLQGAGSAEQRSFANMLTSATSGPIGNEVSAFSTAYLHADLLGDAADALGNGDSQALNKLKNDFQNYFGEATPNNFQVVADAFTREVTKALTSNHITDAEINNNGLRVTSNSSPAQIAGAIQRYKSLMASKIQVRQQQVINTLAGRGFWDNPGSVGWIPAEGQPMATPPARSTPGAPAPPSGVFQVKDPKGYIHTFKTKKELDDFKRDARLP